MKASMKRDVLDYDTDHIHLEELDVPDKGTVCIFKYVGLHKRYVVIWGHKNLGGSLKIFGEFGDKKDAVLYAYAKCKDLNEGEKE